MEIKTEFNIGDRVICLHSDEIYRGVVTNIHIEVALNEEKQHVSYVKYTIDTGVDDNSWIIHHVSEDKIGSTDEEFIKKLMTKSK